MANKRFYEEQKISCSTGEVIQGYSRYLGTRHWQEMRQRVAEESNYTCIRCNGIFKTDYAIHHNSYKRLGKEKLEDLSFYCRRCHTIIHKDRKNRRTFNSQYNNIIYSKMSEMTEEQIDRVMNFIERVSEENEPKNKKKKQKKQI